MAHPAYAVIDLGFGDSGKGTLVDYLVRKTGSKLVVRFNGGAQAGHNVVTPDGRRHHCFSQFGSGTLVPGVNTVLTSDVAIHPLALLNEAKRLAEGGVIDPLGRLTISETCVVTTPYHQALNCLKELSRGKAAHGSCGVGHGETVAHFQATPRDALFAWELVWPDRVERALEKIRLQMLEQANQLPAQDCVDWHAWYDLLSDPKSTKAFCSLIGTLGRYNHMFKSDAEIKELVRSADTPIFEGAQGVLLDEKWGFPPHTTWSNTTGSQIYDMFGFHPGTGSIITIGVVRAFPTRHGAGPFPTEHTIAWKLAQRLKEKDHNVPNKWQGELRVGCFDHVLNRYALDACQLGNFPIKALAVTHLDQLAEHGTWRECEGYDLECENAANESRLRWEEGEARTALLSSVHPYYREVAADEREVIERIEHQSGVPVLVKSFGPTADDKHSLL